MWIRVRRQGHPKTAASVAQRLLPRQTGSAQELVGLRAITRHRRELGVLKPRRVRALIRALSCGVTFRVDKSMVHLGDPISGGLLALCGVSVVGQRFGTPVVSIGVRIRIGLCRGRVRVPHILRAAHGGPDEHHSVDTSDGANDAVCVIVVTAVVPALMFSPPAAGGAAAPAPAGTSSPAPGRGRRQCAVACADRRSGRPERVCTGTGPAAVSRLCPGSRATTGSI